MVVNTLVALEELPAESEGSLVELGKLPAALGELPAALEELPVVPEDIFAVHIMG